MASGRSFGDAMAMRSAGRAGGPPGRAGRPVNIGGLDFSHVFGGYALYVELIFGLPGVGLLTSQTIDSLDLPPIVALAIYLAIVVVLASAIVDLIAAWPDPRIRRPGAAAR